MSKPISFYITYVILVTCALIVSCEEQDVIARDALNLTVPNPFGEVPLFETNNQDGRLIGIHIPHVLDFLLHFRDGSLSTKVDATVLSGLFKLKYDQKRSEDGKMQGPIKLSILGFKAYDNKQEA